MVHLVRPDGSGDHVAFPLVPSGMQFHADWSPNGDRLSFTLRGDRDVIWIGDADGSNTRLAVDCQAPCAWAREAAWSPDGKSLVYARMVVKDGVAVCTLELVDLATGQTHVVLSAPRKSLFGQPRWSPDGSKVVVELAQFPTTNLDELPTGVALAIVDLSAGKPTEVPIPGATGLSNSPDWSWVTNRIVFARPSTPAGFDGPSDLVTMNPDGTDTKVVTSVPPRDGQTPQPAWSPDGLRILFVEPDTTLMTIAIDGSDIQPAIAAEYGRGVHPRYRPLP